MVITFKHFETEPIVEYGCSGVVVHLPDDGDSKVIYSQGANRRTVHLDGVSRLSFSVVKGLSVICRLAWTRGR